MRRLGLAALLLLTGCATPTDAEMKNLDYGPCPNEQRSAGMAIVLLQRTLKDPDSARFEFSSLRRGWYQTSEFREPRFAWLLECRCNAKNSFGGYAGWQGFWFYFVQDRVVAISHAGGGELEEVNGGGLTREQCQPRPPQADLVTR